MTGNLLIMKKYLEKNPDDDLRTEIRKAVFEPEGTIARYEKSYGY